MDGGYILSELTYSYGTGESNVWLIKVEPETDQIFNIAINGSFRISVVVTNTGYKTLIDVN